MTKFIQTMCILILGTSILSCTDITGFSVGGKASGITGTVVLKNNDTESLKITKNGTFEFDTAAGAYTEYKVTIASQPSDQICTLSHSSGTLIRGVTNIALTCEPIAPIVFLSRTQTLGDMSNNPESLTGHAGADALCNADAQTYGTAAVKKHANYTALLITSTSTPCSEVNSVNGCAGSYATSSWPLTPGVTYFNPDGVTEFNTVTSKAIFPDTSPEGALYPDLTYPDGTTPAASTTFWFGVQSIYLLGTTDPTTVTGWAYSDLANSPQYVANLAHCSQWTSQSNSVFGAYGQTENPFHCSQNPCGTSNMWQNYYSDDQGGAEGDTFSASNYNACDSLQHILCVSN